VYVSSLHRRYGLRQGRNRFPRVAFHRNLNPSVTIPPHRSIASISDRVLSLERGNLKRFFSDIYDISPAIPQENTLSSPPTPQFKQNKEDINCKAAMVNHVKLNIEDKKARLLSWAFVFIV
jgi:hypothetical protein